MSDYGSTTPPPPPPPPPPYGGYGAQGAPPPTYLVWAILSTVLGFAPLGVASIVFAARVNNKWAIGDLAGAQSSSEKAKMFAIWSAIVQVIIIAIVVVLALLLGVLLKGFSNVD